MKSVKILSIAGMLTLAAGSKGDILELKNGTILNGKYAGGTAATVRFEASSGLEVIETSQIVALTFVTSPAAAATPRPATAVPTAAIPAAQASTLTLPAGTTMLVRMMDSVSSRNGTGARFATKLEYNLTANGVVAVPAGTLIYGAVASSTQAGRAVGRSTLDLRLSQMVIGGNPVPISTTGYRAAGQASIAKAAKGAAGGAAIGAIAGNAGKGAAIGAVAGAAVRGQTITITPGTLIEFDLTQPATFQAAQ